MNDEIEKKNYKRLKNLNIQEIKRMKIKFELKNE